MWTKIVEAWKDGESGRPERANWSGVFLAVLACFALAPTVDAEFFDSDGGGDWDPGGVEILPDRGREPEPDPDPVGACCLDNFICVVTTAEICVFNSGDFLFGRDCDPNPCYVLDANRGGVLLLHADPSIDYSGSEDYCGQSTLTDCDSVVVSVSGTGPFLAYVMAAFPDSASPRVAGLTFGFEYDDSELFIVDWGSCGSFEWPTWAWPSTGEGTAVTFDPVLTDPINEVYWVAAYNYYGNPQTLQIVEHPTQGAKFGDDSIPSFLVDVECLGALGFDTDGTRCCGTESEPVGACCAPLLSLCELTTSDQCTDFGEVYLGDGTECDPDPCPPVGACCDAGGDCTITWQATCEGGGQTYQGDGTSCDPNPCPGSGCLTAGDVIALMLDEFIPASPFADSLEAYLYDPQGQGLPLPPGTIVAPADSAWSHTLAESSYFVWLDDEPQYEFEHHTTFAFVNECSGAISTISSQSWPEVNGVPVIPKDTDWNKFKANAEPDPVTYTYVPQERSNKDDWAFVVVGRNLTGDGEERARKNDIGRVMQILNGAPKGPRIDKDNIVLLAGPDSTGTSVEALCDTLDTLKGVCNKIYFFYLGHGGDNSSSFHSKHGIYLFEDKTRTKGAKLKYRKLAEKLKEMNAKEFCINIESCYSGGAIAPFQSVNNSGKRDGQSLNGELVTSSSSGKPTQRVNGVGTPYYMGLQTCFNDDESDLNADGKITITEAMVWAAVNDVERVREFDPQSVVLGDGNRYRPNVPKRVPDETEMLGGGKIYFDIEKISIELKEGSSTGEDTTVCRQALYIRNKENRIFRTTKPKRVCAVTGSGVEMPVIDIPKITLPPNSRFCLASLPADTKTLRYKPMPSQFAPAPSQFVADDEETFEVRVATRVALYPPVGSIYQNIDVEGIPGDAMQSWVEAPPAWGGYTDPEFFTFPDYMDSQAVIAKATIPEGQSIGGELEVFAVNGTSGDTTSVRVTALLPDTLVSLGDGDRVEYQNVVLDGGLLSSTSFAELRNSVLRMLGGASLETLGSGGLVAYSVSVLPDSSETYSVDLAGELDLDLVVWMSPADGVRIDGASGTFHSGLVHGSQGPGAVFAGDCSGLDIFSFTVEESQGAGARFEGTDVRVQDLIVHDAGGNDVEVAAGAVVTLQDGSFDTEATVVEPGGQLTRCWTTLVVCSDSAGEPVPGARVIVRDADLLEVSSSVTDSIGAAEPLVLVEFVDDGSVRTPKTDHQIEIQFAGWDTVLTHMANAVSIVEVVLPDVDAVTCADFGTDVPFHEYTNDDPVDLGDGFVGFRNPDGDHGGTHPYSGVEGGVLRYRGGQGSGSDALFIERMLDDGTESWALVLRFQYGSGGCSSRDFFQVRDGSGVLLQIVNSGTAVLGGESFGFSSQPDTWYQAEIVNDGASGEAALWLWPDTEPRPELPTYVAASTGVPDRIEFVGSNFCAPECRVDLVCFDRNILVVDVDDDWDSDPTTPSTSSWIAAPNPFRDGLSVRFQLPKAGLARVDVFDLGGRRVGSLLRQELPAGPAEVHWDGRNGAGREVANGVYFLRLETTEIQDVRRVVKME